jgi:hypothetical protein
MAQPGERNLRHAATGLFGTDMSAEMIGTAHGSSGSKAFPSLIPSLVIRPPSALPSP